MKPRLPQIRWAALALILLAIAWLALPPPPPLTALPCSQRVLDREGRLLRLTLSADEKYRLYTPLAQISPELQAATLLQEDQYFWRHPGVNPVAALRAFAYVALGRRGHGGASTITMQLARLRYRLHTRTIHGKLWQICRALQIERHYTKKEILEAYFNVAPYGGNIEGVGAASSIYFGRSPASLTRSQAVALSVLPQSPTRRAPRAAKENHALLAAASRLSARYEARSAESASVVLEPRASPLQPPACSLQPSSFPAPHFVIRVLGHSAGRDQIVTTLDGALQRLLERRIAATVASGRAIGVKNAAAMLLDFQKMEVLAEVGSADFFDEEISGQVDGTSSRRSPGSTLKPLIYALALDQGLIHPLTMLADAPRRFGAYRPENFDGDFAGPIPAADALARSRNVPAVELASRLSHPTLYQLLKRGGVALPHEEGYYCLALPLGGGEVTMEELVRLYAALANGGRLRPLYRELNHPPASGGLRLLSPEASFLTLDMLGRVPRPVVGSPAGEDGIYWKTGTSMGFRDAWAIAVFDHYVLAVWVGNFDGQRNAAFIGRTCAGPLLFQIIDAMRAEGRAAPHPLTPPPGANLRRIDLCAVSGRLPTAACTHHVSGWFIPGISPIAECDVHREILLDAETGLRLSHDDGTRPVRREIYEFWPSDLQALFESAGLPRRRPPPFAPGAGVEAPARTGNAPRITSLANGQVYALPANGASEGTVTLQASADADVAKLYWFAGKAFLGASPPRETLPWHPTAGVYEVVALDDHGRSTRSQVTVQRASAD